MKCIFCGAPMPKSGLVCGYCGKRNPLNTTSLQKKELVYNSSEAKLSCPVCSIEMNHVNIGIASDIIIHQCSDCDGVFIGEEDLQNTIRHHVGVVQIIDYSTLRFILDNPRHESEANLKHKECPICNERMRKLNYAAVSGVLIDRCTKHGIWLDSGELHQLFEWKSASISLHQQEVAKGREKARRTITKRKYTKEITRDPFDNFLTWLFSGGVA